MNKLRYYFKKICILLLKQSRINKILRYISDLYEKKYNNISILPPPALQGWSIIIITNGHNQDDLNNCIKSAIRELDNSPYEIIVVGPSSLNLSYFSKDIPLIHLPYKELTLWSVPGSISTKKNVGSQFAKYDKLVISHDYIVFMPGWKKGFDDFGDFTAGANIMLNIDGTRHKDWITWDYPNIGQALLPYTVEYTKYQYLNGAYFFVKRDFYLQNPIDKRLRWGEGEDVEWSLRIRQKTKFRFNTQSRITYSKAKPGNSERWLQNTERLEQNLKQK
ncbi:MAG: glycosyltransferase family 2 protein [Minisyncoccota bacterium]